MNYDITKSGYDYDAEESADAHRWVDAVKDEVPAATRVIEAAFLLTHPRRETWTLVWDRGSGVLKEFAPGRLMRMPDLPSGESYAGGYDLVSVQLRPYKAYIGDVAETWRFDVHTYSGGYSTAQQEARHTLCVSACPGRQMPNDLDQWMAAQMWNVLEKLPMAPGPVKLAINGQG